MKRRDYPPDELAARRARELTPESAQQIVDLPVGGVRWLAADPARVAVALGAALAIGALLSRDPEREP